MCSILGILDIHHGAAGLRGQALTMSKTMRHRGPDWSGVHRGEEAILVHERLAIVDPASGAQPLYSPNKQQILAVNGEIYNHLALRQELKTTYDFATESDCEVILPLYLEEGAAFLDRLRGMFAFILVDEDADTYLIARDHMGIIPLYTGRDEMGRLYVASEMKALMGVCHTVEVFPPGHYLEKGMDAPKAYYQRPWESFGAVEHAITDGRALRQALEDSVRSHLKTDVPYGVLLSGGLDSSLVAAIAQQFVKSRVETEGHSPAWWPQLHTYSIGLEGSPDLKAAQVVADHLGTIHHAFTYTLQEGLDALADVIHHLETYDVTTVRASTPMFLMARKIKAMGVKMVLSGEGADEIFGGYLYFHKAPNPEAFHTETVRKLSRLHLYDCLRANKSMAAWGVEARVPFLDKEFMDVAMTQNPAQKMAGGGKIEKHLLREIFEDLLPEEILWRQKEQFSDGVGYGWIDGLKDHAEAMVTDRQMEAAKYRYPVNTPDTKEAYFYRQLFERSYSLPSAVACVPGGPSVACSTPEALAWDASLREAGNDPSGRAVAGVHQDSYGE